jgi:large subunit ribosomal protein L6
MSRVAKKVIKLPSGLSVACEREKVVVTGSRGTASLDLPSGIFVECDGDNLRVLSQSRTDVSSGSDVKASKKSGMFAGTIRALLNNMIVGLSSGYEKKLILVGVGYKVQVKDGIVSLSVGHSHPDEYKLPSGVSAVCASNTELVLKSSDKRLLGQVASQIRSYRPPEVYKGKGIRSSDEVVVIKEAKKK